MSSHVDSIMAKSRSKVYVNDINEKSVLHELQNGLEFIQFRSIVDNKASVFIKPNLTDRSHKPGITTTPLMIRTVVNAVAPCVSSVTIGESDGGNYSFSADASLKNHQVYDIADEYENVDVVNLSKLPRKTVTGEVCGKKVQVDLPNLLLEDIDCLISLAVFKTHAMTHGSFSIKNLWGCYPDPMRLLYHKNLDYKLALINKEVKNRIQILDGFWALDGHGPMEGTPVAINKILVSNDPVAADSTAARLMKLDKNKMTHLRVAEEFGLGRSDIGSIDFNKDISREELPKFLPYKVRLDYLSTLFFKSELISKTVLSSPLTPLVYKLVNLTRPQNKRTYWAEHNKASDGDQ
jgi:uncharacterized protein (DUF362 family)